MDKKEKNIGKKPTLCRIKVEKSIQPVVVLLIPEKMQTQVKMQTRVLIPRTWNYLFLSGTQTRNRVLKKFWQILQKKQESRQNSAL